ncbi:LysR substrate-binding domain-containing protein [Variovorax sp. dw_308]|uniref:LysR family transcriptional regulator n=1 Tax=Variovorax sp. dw_308 TaxID=2721546 RepID=UPI001C489099|nr:LysR substrate-binding domain-containing protein [Variovorax sp. dw_308]
MNSPDVTAAELLLERLLARLRLRHLKLVDALATQANLRRAATAVHMTQPAATQMLRELEATLGMALFERHARGMRITEAGRLVARHARMSIDALRVATEELTALATQRVQPLRVGAIDAAIASVLEPVLLPLLAAHPELRLEIEESNIERLSAGLRNGAFDMVLVREPVQLEPGHRFVALRSDRVVVVASTAHPAARRRRLRLADLAQSRWILPPAHYAVRRALDALWAQEAHPPSAHNVQTLAPHLLRSMLAQPDVVVPVPHSLLDRLGRHGIVELPLELHAPIEPLGMLFRGSEAEGSLAVLIDFLVASIHT